MNQQYKVLVVIGAFFLLLLLFNGEHVFSVFIWKVHNATVCINDEIGENQLYRGTLSCCLFSNEYQLNIGTNETISFHSDQIHYMSWQHPKGWGRSWKTSDRRVILR